MAELDSVNILKEYPGSKRIPKLVDQIAKLERIILDQSKEIRNKQARIEHFDKELEHIKINAKTQKQGVYLNALGGFNLMVKTINRTLNNSTKSREQIVKELQEAILSARKRYQESFNTEFNIVDLIDGDEEDE